MQLFGHPDSGHAYKVKFLLEHAGIPHDYEVVDISFLLFADEAHISVPTYVQRWSDRLSGLEGWRHPYPMCSLECNLECSLEAKSFS